MESNILVKAEKLTVDFPIFGTRSLKNTLLTSFTGGLIKMTEKNKVVRALDKITIQFSTGERIGLWGHNGSGKTTLLRVLAGIYSPTNGTLKMRGRVTSLLNISLGMNPEATGIENIFLRGALMGYSNKEIKNKLQEIIDFTELGEFIHLPMRTYSSGMQMRLGFSVSTSMDADIILMDEWLSVGDESFKTKATQRLNSMLTSAKLLVIASHSKSMLNTLCTRILHIEHGFITNEELCGPAPAPVDGTTGVETKPSPPNPPAGE